MSQIVVLCPDAYFRGEVNLNTLPRNSTFREVLLSLTQSHEKLRSFCNDGDVAFYYTNDGALTTVSLHSRVRDYSHQRTFYIRRAVERPSQNETRSRSNPSELSATRLTSSYRARTPHQPAQQPQPRSQEPSPWTIIPGIGAAKPKSGILAVIFAFVFGGFGLHNFYLGHWKNGFMQLGLTFGCLGFLIPLTVIWGWIDAIRMATGSLNDGRGLPLDWKGVAILEGSGKWWVIGVTAPFVLLFLFGIVASINSPNVNTHMPSGKTPETKKDGQATPKAKPIEVKEGKALVNAELNAEEDHYTIALQIGKKYQFILSGEFGSARPLVRLIAKGGVIVGTPQLGGRLMVYQATATETFFVTVTSWDGTGRGPYQLRVSDLGDPKKAEDAMELLKRAVANATRIVFQNGKYAVNGLLKGPFDVYGLEAKKGERFGINMTSTVFDATLLVGTREKELAKNNDGGEGSNSHLVFTAPADGTYFVAASSNGASRPEEATGRGPYQLSIEKDQTGRHPKPTPEPNPAVKVKVIARLGNGQFSESININIGNQGITLMLSKTRPVRQSTITLPRAGIHRYTIRSTTRIVVRGSGYYYEGVGEGVVAIRGGEIVYYIRSAPTGIPSRVPGARVVHYWAVLKRGS